MTASKPVASGTGSPPMSSTWTIVPRRARARSCSSPKLASSVSNVTRSPTCVNVAPSKSNPSALFGHSDGLASQRKRGVWIDEAPDEPGAGHPVDPELASRRPGPAAVLAQVELGHLALRLARLVGRQDGIDPLAEVRPRAASASTPVSDGKKSTVRSASNSLCSRFLSRVSSLIDWARSLRPSTRQLARCSAYCSERSNSCR